MGCNMHPIADNMISFRTKRAGKKSLCCRCSRPATTFMGGAYAEGGRGFHYAISGKAVTAKDVARARNGIYYRYRSAEKPKKRTSEECIVPPYTMCTCNHHDRRHYHRAFVVESKHIPPIAITIPMHCEVVHKNGKICKCTQFERKYNG